jgi:hypothetical protein
MGRISTRVADQTKGGFLDDVDGEIVSAKYARGSFVGDDGNTVNKTQAILGVQIEGREEPVPVFLSIGNADLICPYEDEDCTVEADEGQYLGAKGEKEYKGVSQDSAWGRFQAQLVAKLKFPDANFDAPLEDALVGLRGHFTSLPGGKYKGKVGKPVTVFQTIEKDTIPVIGGKKKSPAKPAAGGGLGKLKKAAKPAPVEEEVEETEEVEEETPAPPAKKTKPAAVKAKPKAAPAEEEAADEDDIEAAVGEAVIAAVAKTPLPKGQLAQRVGKVFEGQDNRAAAVQLSMSDKFLKAGVEAGLWAYDGRTISAAE